MFVSKSTTLAFLSLAVLGSGVQGAKVTFCVRDSGNEDQGYGPYDVEVTREEHLEDYVKKYTAEGKEVHMPGSKAHVHGIDGRLSGRCKLVHDNGDSKMLSLCYRTAGTDGNFGRKRGVVEVFTKEFMAKYDGMETAWAGSKVMIKGEKKWLTDNCAGSDEKHVPSVYGDPHFKTWAGDTFDFHGACDLVMLDNPSFANGLGLKIHIRTKISSWWSFIETAVVQIGANSVEVTGSKEGSPTFSINQGEPEKVPETAESTLGDHPLTLKLVNDHQAMVRLDLGNGNGVSVETFKRFVRVNMGAPKPDYFAGSVGIMGSYTKKEMLARDGKTVMTDPIAFGQEWQVLSSEPMLFHSVGEVHHPNKCTMPALKAKEARRLGEGGITEEEAALACARVVGQLNRESCIFDVLATNDKEMAGSY